MWNIPLATQGLLCVLPQSLISPAPHCGGRVWERKALVLCQPCWAVGRALGCYQGWFIHNYTPQHLSSATGETPLLPSQPQPGIISFLGKAIFLGHSSLSNKRPALPASFHLCNDSFDRGCSGCSATPAVLLPVAVPGCGMEL